MRKQERNAAHHLDREQQGKGRQNAWHRQAYDAGIIYKTWTRNCGIEIAHWQTFNSDNRFLCNDGIERLNC